jgi:NADH-quinone oxidoreductase subunit L
MFRIVFLAFHGERAEHVASSHDAPAHDAPSLPAPSHLHDAPPAMAFALIVLAVGAAVAGYVGLPAVLGGSDWFARFLEPSFTGTVAHEISESTRVEGILMVASTLVAMSGIAIAMYFFQRQPRAADAVADRFAGVRRVLTNKYYVDEIYDAAIVQPIRIVSEDALWKFVDVRVIDAAVNGVGESVAGASEGLRRVQTGSVRTYAASLFLGVVLILGYYLWP